MAGLDNREPSLIRFAEESEDAADGLYKFRESLPRSATRITAIVSELFAISSALRAIHNEDGTRQYGPSFYRIQEDLGLVFRSLRMTLDELFGMFARARERPDQMVWEDLNYRFDEVEKFGLLERLVWYRHFLNAQHEILEGHRSQGLGELRQDLKDVLQAQEAALRRHSRTPISGTSTPRPRPRRPSRPAPYPISPTVSSSDHDSWERPPNLGPAPEPPISPLFSSGSSQTMSSSQTSYSSETYIPTTPGPLVHWSENIFDGRHPTTPYRQPFQLLERSSCHGDADPMCLQHLVRDGFQRALQLSFDEERFWVRLYWRPTDFRARILIMTADVHGQQLHFCQPLTNLKVIRKGSSLQLCRFRREGRYTLWARLNFIFHERMVLFYSTFVAMKRQDQRGVGIRQLVDDAELISDAGEQELFAGEMRHGQMYHALRIFRDNASGAVRLEASALRGSKKDVPIWTAFVTKYAYDPDWAHFEGNGVVSLIAIRPPPYVFILRYEPPRNSLGAYVLPFTSNEDAMMFMETWSGLGRHV
ncbi:hypothetical protein M409DRAFT_66175 [Zasmidium cellare ATCC 36951]|uniref:Uncharacterized protein n=1 Tax=Zasmidium cellare ATCC 36951 TaxID=1080233 RepID=A0A6A6CJ96_ZASCE|nr:uncharacterized protein M409DRAFT_66175 [Zasmidium cellare ATCC 36951]KAF2167111.1 hypothetical protein M409DRAFT_66175 [Zasmidium cellare ATCC 36951]